MTKTNNGLVEDYILNKVTVDIKDPDDFVYKLSFKPYGSGATTNELKYKFNLEKLKEFCELHGIPFDTTVPVPVMNRVITIRTSKTQKTIDDFEEEEDFEE